MSRALNKEEIYDLFETMTDVEIHSATCVIKEGEEKDKIMGQGYILAIQRTKTILRTILKQEVNDE